MRLRPDALILVVLVGLSAWAVATQVTSDPLSPYDRPLPPPLSIGDRVDDFTLKDVGGTTRTLSGWAGGKATVLYFWGTDCPCVKMIEKRVKALMNRYHHDPAKGVRFIGVASDPADTPERALEGMGEIHAEYAMLLDPEQEVARRLGGYQASQVVVLDADRRVRYRGAIDDALVKPTREYLGPALDAILYGGRVDPVETTPYGCPFPGFEGKCPLR